MNAPQKNGFTLIEIVIALAILAISLTMLLAVQVSSYNNAGRSRDITIATMLARSKMIDIEQYLFDEGFKEGEENDSGNFSEEGFDKIKWSYRIFEIEMDLSNLGMLAEGFSEDEDDDMGGEFEGMMGMFGGIADGLMSEISASMRMVELTVTWPVGSYEESMSVRGLMTRDDYKIEPPMPF